VGDSRCAWATSRGRGGGARSAYAVWLERVATSAIDSTGPPSDSTLCAFDSNRTATYGVMEATAHRSADRVAGFLCAFSFALSGVALARTPGLLAPVAILVALIAVRMTEAHRTLAAVAVAVSGLAFFFGMVIAITTDGSLF
jgi:hypothetical protein